MSRAKANPRDPAAFLPLTARAFHILLSLVEEPRHGYAIIRDIEERAGKDLHLRSGTLYTAIHRLQEDGLLVEVGDREIPEGGDERRRYYRLTPLGHQVAALEAARLSAVVSTAREKRLLDQEG